MEALRPFHTFAQIFVIFFHDLLNRRKAAKQYFYFSFFPRGLFSRKKNLSAPLFFPPGILLKKSPIFFAPSF